jgi:energy-coupling factor transport system ATP-binding protein
MIEFENFSFGYRASEQPVLKGISLSIRKGECVLLHGPSGCGKSTLCLTLNGIIPHLIGGTVQGEVLVKGRSTRSCEVRDLACDVGLVFQNPDNQIFALTVEEDVAFGPENLGFGTEIMHRRVGEALAATGLVALRQRPDYRLSGGQKQRTAIAGLCAMQPDILVFDEPTSDLDPRGTQDVISLIDRLHREQGKTIIIVEHKIREVLPIVDRVITMNDGSITGDCSKNAVDPDEFCPPYPVRSIQKKGPNRTLMDICDVSYSYPDGTRALENINLSIYQSECVAFIGENGSGKTTLSKIIKGLLSPDRGQVQLYDNAGDGRVVPDRSKKIGYLFQNPDHQIVTDRVDKEIAVGLADLPVAQCKERTQKALEMVGLSRYAQCDPCTLSRGERQRLAVASILAMEPKILIFDEPTTGQDYPHLMAIMNFMEQLRMSGKTILMITHDHALARAFADRIIVMKQGKIMDTENVSCQAHS